MAEANVTTEPMQHKGDMAAELPFDPHAALRYGYPPGTWLRFATLGDVKAELLRSRRFGTAVPPLRRLLVLHWCSEPDSCSEEVAIHDASGGQPPVRVIKRFGPGEGTVQSIKPHNGMFELRLLRDGVISTLCVWPMPPAAATVIEAGSADDLHVCPRKAP